MGKAEPQTQNDLRFRRWASLVPGSLIHAVRRSLTFAVALEVRFGYGL